MYIYIYMEKSDLGFYNRNNEKGNKTVTWTEWLQVLHDVMIARKIYRTEICNMYSL